MKNWTVTERFETRHDRESRYSQLVADGKKHLIRATTQELSGLEDEQGRKLGKVVWLLHRN